MKHGVVSNLTPLGIFGDAIVRTVTPVAEASDQLAQTMLQMCNCDPYLCSTGTSDSAGMVWKGREGRYPNLFGQLIGSGI